MAGRQASWLLGRLAGWMGGRAPVWSALGWMTGWPVGCLPARYHTFLCFDSNRKSGRAREREGYGERLIERERKGETLAGGWLPGVAAWAGP